MQLLLEKWTHFSLMSTKEDKQQNNLSLGTKRNKTKNMIKNIVGPKIDVVTRKIWFIVLTKGGWLNYIVA